MKLLTFATSLLLPASLAAQGSSLASTTPVPAAVDGLPPAPSGATATLAAA